MASNNPYQSPASRSSGVGPSTPGFKTMLFSTQGRIPRSTFWTWTLVIMAAFAVLVAIIMVPLLMIEKSAEAKATKEAAESVKSAQLIALAIFIIGYIPLFWASAVIQVKRWHDRGKSGAWFFINFIPYIGALWALIECGFLRGTDGPNQYGSDPT